MTYIYILERNNIPFYVGKAKDVIRRKHKHYSTYGTEIKLVIIDEGFNWKQLECFWIEQFRQWGFQLLNKNKGGGGPESYSEITKNKMRKPKPIGTGDKISKSLLEGNHTKYYTQEVRDKISIGNKNRQKPFTKQHTLNMGLAKLKDSKPVLQLDLEGNIIREWESKGLAAKYFRELTGKNSNITSQIKDCILGKQKTALKYKWKYKYE